MTSAAETRVSVFSFHQDTGILFHFGTRYHQKGTVRLFSRMGMTCGRGSVGLPIFLPLTPEKEFTQWLRAVFLKLKKNPLNESSSSRVLRPPEGLRLEFSMSMSFSEKKVASLFTLTFN